MLELLRLESDPENCKMVEMVGWLREEIPQSPRAGNVND